MFNYRPLLLSLTLIPSIALVGSMNLHPASSQGIQVITQPSTGWISIFRRRPKKTLGSRSILCKIAPGILGKYTIWSDRPLFLWQYAGKPQQGQLIVRKYDSEEEVWRQAINFTDKKVVYGGNKPLQPNTIYQWKLVSKFSNHPWKAFKIMSVKERQVIQAKLQEIEQQSQNKKVSDEDIALQKANFLVNYQTDKDISDVLWSDALQALYSVNKPSQAFIKERKELVTSLCTSKSN